MLEETYHFVSNAVDENVPVTDFIQSDYTFINQDLARHYKMEGIEGIHFQRFPCQVRACVVAYSDRQVS